MHMHMYISSSITNDLIFISLHSQNHNRDVALYALENLVQVSSNQQQVLTSLRSGDSHMLNDLMHTLGVSLDSS